MGYDLRLLENDDRLEVLAERVVMVFQAATEASEDGVGSLSDYVLGEFDDFIEDLAAALEDAPPAERKELTSYPGYVYLGLGEMFLWERDQGDDEDEDEDEDEDDDVASCPACPGEGVLMGHLGNRAHYRCRHCGMQFSAKKNPVDPKDLVAAIRADPLVGEGSCSSIDETMDDSDLIRDLAEDGVTTIAGAIKWARDSEGLWLEQGTNVRWGEDDDPQLLAMQEFDARRKELEGK